MDLAVMFHFCNTINYFMLTRSFFALSKVQRCGVNSSLCTQVYQTIFKKSEVPQFAN